jgi:membrane fusion protein (multidrug efflux system)
LSIPSRVLIFALPAAFAAWIAYVIVTSMFLDDSTGGRYGGGPTPVVVTIAEVQEFSDVLEAIGTARANESVIITAKVTEMVRATHFTDGQHVEKNAILVELTSAQDSAELTAARAEFDEANKQFDRIADLQSRGTVSQSRLDQQRALRDTARARMGSVEARLADRLIKAPFAGALGLRLVSPGTLVQPGDTITTLDDIRIIKIDFSVPENFLSALQPGLTISSVSAAYPERLFEGIVKTVDTRVDPVTRSVVVRAEIDNEEALLRPGMLLTIDLINNKRRSIVIPEEALVAVKLQKFVYVVGDDLTAARREVTIGRRRPGVVEILDGLSEGEAVITRGTHIVRDGGAVKVIDEDQSQSPPAASVMRQPNG